MQRFHFEFIGRKKVWFGISGTIIILGIIAMMLGGLKWGVEFQGGNQFDVKFKKAPTVEAIRTTLATLKLGQSTIQPVGTGNEYLIRSERLSGDTRGQVETALKKAFPVTDISARDIGPGWGQQVTDGAWKALIASMFVLLLYISIRFEFKMAVSAILALFHDGLVVVGIYALVGLLEAKLGLAWIPSEITPNTVAALLTILGFSLYDTIVVFHRIKENAEIIGKRTYSIMVNDSMNQVLMRSINTSLTALIPVFVLLIFGGQTLKDFAFAMFVGLISGAYSSIFIASPILALWKETEPRYIMVREKLARGGKGEAAASSKERTTPTETKGFTPEAPQAGNIITGVTSDEVGMPPPAMTPTPKQKTAAQKAKKKAKKKKRR